MINNRQNGRRRGRGGGQRQGGGGQGQRDSGNRIDSRARGNAAQLLEKYKNLARDAQMSGDRVNTEYYLQFADHYFRVLADQRGRTDDQPQRRTRDDFDQFDDIDDFGDEGEPIRGEEQVRASEGDAPQRDRSDRGDRSRDRQRDGGRDGGREFAGREGREDRRPAREDRQDRRNGHAAPVEGARNGHGAGADEDRAPLTAAPAEAAATDEAAAPRRRTRKPREAAAPVEATGFDADRLPPSLGISAVEPAAAAPAADDAGEEAPKPRRRRVRTAAAEAAAE